jgi:hypothetical protein
MAGSRLPTMVDHGVLAAIGAAIVGFGIVAFVFRVQREIQVEETLVREWKDEAKQRGTAVDEEELLKKAATYRSVPWADRLLVCTVTVALLLVLLPIALVGSMSSFWGGRLPAAGCSASTVALAGYIPALLAHYQFGPRPVRRWIWFGDPSGPRRYAVEPAEKAIVIVSAILGMVAAVVSFGVTG